MAKRSIWAATRRYCVAGLLALISAVASAQAELPDCPPGEEAAVRSYAPTAAKLKAYTDALAAFIAAGAQDPSLAPLVNKTDLTGQCRNDANEQGLSFAGAQAVFTKYPRVGSIFASQGISPREMVIWGKLALLMVLASNPQVGAGARDELSPAQQAFLRDNKAGVERLAVVVMSGAKKPGAR